MECVEQRVLGSCCAGGSHGVDHVYLTLVMAVDLEVCIKTQISDLINSFGRSSGRDKG